MESYDDTNMQVFALSVWEKLSWDLTYFDEFIIDSIPHCHTENALKGEKTRNQGYVSI